MSAQIRQILLIEPEPILRLTVASFLERAGYDVVALADLADALAAVDTHAARPLAVLLSTRRLDAGVLRLARRLREVAPRVPIVCVADAVDGDEADAVGLPSAMRVLAHPVDIPDLLGAIRSTVRSTASGSGATVERLTG